MEEVDIKRAKIQKTQSIEAYWSYYCKEKEEKDWVHNGKKKAVILQSITKNNKTITYVQFSTLLKLYYKKASNLIIKGYRLRFDYGLGNLRIIRYDGKSLICSKQAILYKNTDNIDFNIPQCTFYFHRDKVDFSRKKEKINNIELYELNIARSNGKNDKTLGLKFKLSHMIKINPMLVQLFDVKIINIIEQW